MKIYNRKIALTGTAIIFVFFLSLALQINVFASYGNDINSGGDAYINITNQKKHILEKSAELMSNDSSNVVTAFKIDGDWHTEIKAHLINKYWAPDDEFMLQISDDMNISFVMRDKSCIVSFNGDDFQTGTVAVLLFHNQTKYEYKTLFVNFSDSDMLVLQSDDMKRLVLGDITPAYYIPGTGKLRQTTILPEQGIVEKQENTGIIPPHQNELAKKVLVFRVNDIEEIAYDVRNAIKGNISDMAEIADNDAFNVYSVADELIHDFQSPFAAIEYIVENDYEGYYVKEANIDQELFRYEKNREDLYYVFNRSKFEGTATAGEATGHTINGSFMHVVRADGIFGAGDNNWEALPKGAVQPYAHSYYSETNKELWTLDGNMGAYVYKSSIYSGSYSECSSLILLSQTQLRPYGNNGKPYTAYNYLGLHTINLSFDVAGDPSLAIACELGVMSGSDDRGNWFLFTNINDGGNIELTKVFPDDPIVTSTYISESDEFEGNQDVFLYLSSLKPGYVYITAINAKTLKIQQACVNSPKFDPNNELSSFVEGTKLVPKINDLAMAGTRFVTDINSGAYLRNVCWYKSLLYAVHGNKRESTIFGLFDQGINYLIYDYEHAMNNFVYSYEAPEYYGNIVDIHYSPIYR